MKAQLSKLAQVIRAKSRRQSALWRKIPRLAFLANGKTGFNGQLGIAVMEGFWQINEGSVSVDLLTGELVDSYSVLRRYSPKYGVPHLASDEQVVTVIGSQPDLIDAKALVAGMEREALRKIAAYMNRAGVIEWRQSIRKRLRATPKKKRSYVSYAKGQAIRDLNIRRAVEKGELVPHESSGGCMGVHIRL